MTTTNYFSKNEIDLYVNVVLNQASDVVDDYISYNISPCRYEFPIFFEKGSYYREFYADILIMNSDSKGVVLNALNIPGCMAYGIDKKNALINFLRAYFECEDFRHQNRINKMNQIYIDVKSYGLPTNDIKFEDLISDLENKDWKIEKKFNYNTILMNIGKSRKMTFTIPNWEIIPGMLHQMISRWLFAEDKSLLSK